MTEFELIARFFDRPLADGRASLGIGDDCALLAARPGHELAISTDMLVAGRHFFDDVDPASLGWKALAVNLSDLAAMGARPRAFTLALALPTVDEAWLAAFADGLFDCASGFDCALVGGDTTRGPLTLCITVFGDVPDGRALRRSAARDGDDVWVSGTLGSAALALNAMKTGREPVDPMSRLALERPVPRVALGVALRDVAHAAIDVSDGLAQDLGHVLAASGVGATLDVDALPLAAAVARGEPGLRRRVALAGGDDYELCFTAPSSAREAVERAGRATSTRVTRIGFVTTTKGLRLAGSEGLVADDRSLRGFDHFA